MNILGIESSCDETSVSIVQDGLRIIAHQIASQVSYHGKYGGVVPEIASRRHIESIIPLMSELFHEAQMDLKDIDAIAVTVGPGLIGSLLIGVSVAKTMAYVKQKALIPINHIEGHIKAVFLAYPTLDFPFVALVVSGGHTSLFIVYNHTNYEFLGGTRDDAAGEAFDKVAKILHLGYPGGPIIDQLAKTANPAAVRFPRAYMKKDPFDFSFSGLKTAVFTYVRSRQEKLSEDGKGCPQGKVPPEIRDIVASFQEAVVDTLVFKAIEACRQKEVRQLILAGGVACNSRLRDKVEQAAQKRNIRVFSDVLFTTRWSIREPSLILLRASGSRLEILLCFIKTDSKWNCSSNGSSSICT